MTEKASLGLFGVVDENMILLMSAYLTSAETSRLRSASQSSASIFIRNAPCTNTIDVFFEALEEPDLKWESLDYRLGRYDSEDSDDDEDDPRYNWPCSLTEVPRRNRFSALRVFRLDASDAGRLLYFEPQRRFAFSLWRNKAFVLAAVTQDGDSLMFADESFRSDRDVVLAAVTQDGESLMHADESF